MAASRCHFLRNHMKTINYRDKEAEELLSHGEVICIPTETVYGLAIRFDSTEAYDLLCKAKNRKPEKAIAVMCGRNFSFDEYFEINDGIKRVMNEFLPGPLTCLVRTKDKAPFQTHLGTCIAGIRIPDKPELLEFLDGLPFALQCTSANISGQPSIKEYDEVIKVFDDNPYVSGIVKGKCESGVPTTVVDLTGDEPKIIREGEITLKQIRDAYYI